MSAETDKLQGDVDDLKRQVVELRQQLTLERQKRESQDYISFVQGRLQIKSPQLVKKSVISSKISLDPMVGTVTAVAGFTPLYDSNGALLKVAVLT